MELYMKLTANAVDHTTALNRLPAVDFLGLTHGILIGIRIQELGRVILPVQ